jgi:leader peptidase (prepilin peptidase)/N-methyltransferase
MLFVWLAVVFLLGAVIGTYVLNPAIYRLPFEKSLLWPGWRCASCSQPVRWYDTLPLVGWWLRLGHCRTCGARFSFRFFFVELFTGLCFVGLFYLDVVVNVHRLSSLPHDAIAHGEIPWTAWVLFTHHALLVCFLLVASFIDLDHFEIPLPVTTTGTLVGLVGAVLLPWPWPDPLPPPPPPPPPIFAESRWIGMPFEPKAVGVYSWPVWHPLPGWLAPGGNWQTGLLTGLAGVLVGTMMLRAVRFIFGVGRGTEGLGVGDADLMMMAGAFLGWQPVVIAFFVSVFPALVIGVTQLLFRGKQELAFGPSLSVGIMITMLCWRWIGGALYPIFFDGTMLLILGVAAAIFLLIASFVIRLTRGRPEPPKE